MEEQKMLQKYSFGLSIIISCVLALIVLGLLTKVEYAVFTLFLLATLIGLAQALRRVPPQVEFKQQRR